MALRPTFKPTRLALALVLVGWLGIPAAAVARLGCPTYHPSGAYPLVGDPAQEPVLDQQGVVASHGLPLHIAASGRAYRNIDDIAWYGLEGWTHWRRTGRPSGLAQARRSGDWLVAHQPPNGGWRYPIPLSMTGLGIDRPLRPGWIAAQAEGDSISLLVRLYRATSHVVYLRAAERALGPYERPSSRHGFRVVFRRHVFFDGFPSSPPSLVLEDFQIALVGLADLAQFDSVAARLFDEGLSALYWALPLLDDEGKPIFSLTYLTQPGAPRLYEAAAHTLNTLFLCELVQMRPSARASRYVRIWEASDPHAYYH